MAPFEYPCDRLTSEKALLQFTHFATNMDYKNAFEEAIQILYSSCYCIELDLTKRMNFHCKLCNKTMNNTQALQAHDVSANHLKNADRHFIESGTTRMNEMELRKYPSYTIENQILRSSSPILGVHMVEAYAKRNTQWYYKCILCGSHGKKEAIYKHVLGDKHTDRFIMYSLRIQGSALTAELRAAARKLLLERDGVDVSKIITITESKLYPSLWEQEALSHRALIDRYARDRYRGGRSSPSIKEEPGTSSSSHYYRSSSSSRAIKEEPGTSSSSSHYYRSSRDTRSRRNSSSGSDSDRDYKSRTGRSNRKDKYSSSKTSRAIIPKVEPGTSVVLQTPLGVSIMRDDRVQTKDASVQVFGHWAVERCLTKLNFINHTQHLACSKVRSPSDAEHTIRLMFGVGNLLYFAIRSKMDKLKKSDGRKKTIEKLKDAERVMMKLQGYVRTNMGTGWQRYNPSDPRDDILIEDHQAWAAAGTR